MLDKETTKKYKEIGFDEKVVRIVAAMEDAERKDWYAIATAAMEGNEEARELLTKRFGKTEKMAFLCYQVSRMCYSALSNVEKIMDKNRAELAIQRIKTEYDPQSDMSDFLLARTEAGLSRAELSRILDIPVRTIENWENGISQPPAWAGKLVLEKIRSLKEAGE